MSLKGIYIKIVSNLKKKEHYAKKKKESVCVIVKLHRDKRGFMLFTGWIIEF